MVASKSEDIQAWIEDALNRLAKKMICSTLGNVNKTEKPSENGENA
jgi:hypothetical protein